MNTIINLCVHGTRIHIYYILEYLRGTRLKGVILWQILCVCVCVCVCAHYAQPWRSNETNKPRREKQTRDNMHAILMHSCLYNNQPDPRL